MEPTIDFTSVGLAADLYGEIEKLRAKHWCARSPDGLVMLSQEDAKHVMRCVDFGFSFYQINPEVSPYLAEAVKHELLNMHGDEHHRVQALVLRALREQTVDGLRDRIRSIADELIDAMPTNGVIDLVETFTHPFPSLVLGPMLGVSYAESEGLDEWISIAGRKVDALRSGDDITPVEDADRKMHDFLRELLVERKRNLGDDVLSELIVAEIDGDRLGDDELVYLSGELVSAGVDTTRNQLPLTLEALIRHPDQMAALCADPWELSGTAVEEGMRYAPLPFAIPHRVLRTHDHRGERLTEGDLVFVMIPAVNRDPEATERPHEFDLSRERPRHFSFGYGMHYCTGAHLARIEMAIALEQLATRLSGWRLVEQPPRSRLTLGSAPLELKVELSRTG